MKKILGVALVALFGASMMMAGCAPKAEEATQAAPAMEEMTPVAPEGTTITPATGTIAPAEVTPAAK